MIESIEDKKNKLNFEIRQLLTVIDLIDGLNEDYPDYINGTLDEEHYLNEQIILVEKAKNRLVNVFKN